jgi:WD40 repeat protein
LVSFIIALITHVHALVAFSNDGSLFAVGLVSGKIIVYSTEQVAFQAEMMTGTTAIVATMSENTGLVSDLAFHPTLPVLAAASHVRLGP